MLKVMLADDEQFILDGLRVLIDWEQEGFEICKCANDGEEALAYAASHELDLIISDIKMPGVNGIRLLEILRREYGYSGYFLLLSGFADFQYAKEAIRHRCDEYMLKPVDKEELLSILEKVVLKSDVNRKRRIRDKHLEEAYLREHLLALLKGKYMPENLSYVQENLFIHKEVKYVEVSFDDDPQEEYTEAEELMERSKLYHYCREFLKEYERHCLPDNYSSGNRQGVGILFIDDMRKSLGTTEESYFTQFKKYLDIRINKPTVFYVGKAVSGLAQISRSYGNVHLLRSLRGFRDRKDIYFYENEERFSAGGIVLCGESLNGLIKSVEDNDRERILHCIDVFFGEISKTKMSERVVNLNMNYLLFRLIYMASDLDAQINQEEVLEQIGASSLKEGIERGGKEHLIRFCSEYGEYLSQLRKRTSHSLLRSIEMEIRQHFRENITLKELSKKYFINSAYLGQLFKKNFNQSFKDYLNSVRIEKAAELLIKTDKKIVEVAEEAGYKDVDYFVNRFVAVKGCSPAKFRRQ